MTSRLKRTASFVLVWASPTLAVLGVCFAGVAPAYSQEFLRYQVYGTLGAGAWTSRDYNAGRATGPICGGGFEYRWSRKLGVGADYSFWRASGLTHLTSPGAAGAVKTAADFAASGGVASVNLIWHGGAGRVQPYAMVGVGVEHSVREKPAWNNPATNKPTNDVTKYSAALHTGFGVEVFIVRRLALRPEVRVYFADPVFMGKSPGWQAGAAMGMGYHW